MRIKPQPGIYASERVMVWIERVVDYDRIPARSSVNDPVNDPKLGLNRCCTALVAAALLAFSAGLQAQNTARPSDQPAQQPKTAPNTESILSSYEGQNVTAIEIAGRPGLD